MCAVGLGVLAACGDDQAGAGQATTASFGPDVERSHARMVEELRAIAASTDDADLYQGTAKARELARHRESLGPQGSWNLYLDSGVAELQAGREALGIELLEEAYRRAERRRGRDREAALRQVRFQLAVAYLRLAETENCCASAAPEACILPFAEPALHTVTRGSERAIRYLEELLASTPDDDRLHLGARWLLNLAHMTLGTFPDGVAEPYRLPSSALGSDRGFPRFENVAAAAGVDTFSLSGGAIADDFDGDGDLDLVVSSWDRRHGLRFWERRDDGSYRDRSEAAGFAGVLGGLNLLQADYDNDGDLDILVLRGAWLGDRGTLPNSLLQNDGSGRFRDVTYLVGLGDEHRPTQTAAWADFDLDGDLDLYVGNESSDGERFAGQLFRNDGDRFVDVAATAGVENLRFAKAVSWGDIDGDRDPDLYVSNNGQPNRLYLNRGDGTFEDVAVERGVDGPETSFPAWFWDADDDGALDLFVSSYSTDIDHHCLHLLDRPFGQPGMALYMGDGSGGFVNRAQEAGLVEPVMPMGSNFGDLDGDGHLDLYLGTGNVHYYSLMPNALFVADGRGGFDNVTMASGFGHLQKGHGVVFADLDGDGDLDVFEQMGGAYRGDGFRDALWENPGFGNAWIGVRLEGTRSPRCAIGARIAVDYRSGNGTERRAYRHVNSGGSFGANPLRQHVGLGADGVATAVEVFWPTTGETQRFAPVPTNAVILLTEGRDEVVVGAVDPVRLGGR